MIRAILFFLLTMGLATESMSIGLTDLAPSVEKPSTTRHTEEDPTALFSRGVHIMRFYVCTQEVAVQFDSADRMRLVMLADKSAAYIKALNSGIQQAKEADRESVDDVDLEDNCLRI